LSNLYSSNSASGNYTTMPSVPINLATLPAHSIFDSGSGNEKQDDWEVVDPPNGDLVGTKSSRMILRDKDLIVAHGAEVRMCSLAGDTWKVDDGVAGAYKVSQHPSRGERAKLIIDTQGGMPKFSSRVAGLEPDRAIIGRCREEAGRCSRASYSSYRGRNDRRASMPVCVEYSVTVNRAHEKGIRYRRI